jgi:hypothetical protein
MWFEGRKLDPYMRPVPSDELIAGGLYYDVGFYGDGLNAVYLEPYIFLGKDIMKCDDDMKGALYFQDAASYFEGRRIEKDPNDVEVLARFEGADDPQSHGMCTLENAVDVVLRHLMERKSPET